LLDLPETLSDDVPGDRLARMYTRYADETLDFAEAVSTGKRRVHRAGVS
jgi:hypothetical protein